MNIKKMIDNYVECNQFEIKMKDNKITIYYYDKVENFSDSKVIVTHDSKTYSILGKNLIIETMFKEFITISGNITDIKLGQKDA